MVKINYTDSFLEAYYNDIANRRFRDFDNKTLEQIYDEKFRSWIGIDLKTILVGEYDRLPKIDLDEAQKKN
jgi:hypothetical protein